MDFETKKAIDDLQKSIAYEILILVALLVLATMLRSGLDYLGSHALQGHWLDVFRGSIWRIWIALVVIRAVIWAVGTISKPPPVESAEDIKKGPRPDG